MRSEGSGETGSQGRGGPRRSTILNTAALPWTPSVAATTVLPGQVLGFHPCNNFGIRNQVSCENAYATAMVPGRCFPQQYLASSIQ